MLARDQNLLYAAIRCWGDKQVGSLHVVVEDVILRVRVRSSQDPRWNQVMHTLPPLQELFCAELDLIGQ